MKWKHFPRHWPFVRGIHRSTVNSPHKGQWRGALMFLWSAPWINGWVNNREAGDLRHHRAHYDAIVMIGPVYWSLGDSWPLCRTISPATKWSDGLLVLQIRAMICCTAHRSYSPSVRCPVDSTYSKWWRHQKETFSALPIICAGNSPVTGEFPAQRPVTRTLDIFFDLRLHKRLSKQSWGWRLETPSRPLWRHCNEAYMLRLSFPVLVLISPIYDVWNKEMPNIAFVSKVGGGSVT